MTAMRADSTGRSTGRMKTAKPNKIAGQFIAHTVAMRTSPAWSVLGLEERLILERLEVENASHGGKENGDLPCTYDDFARGGCRRASVAGAIRVLVALGFVEVTARGRAGNAEFRTPNRYRLTYLAGNLMPTNEWSRIATRDEAEERARTARAATGEPRAQRTRKPKLQAHG